MTEGSATPAAPARLVTGSTLRHVITMTGASAIGLVAVFAVEALSLFYIGLLGQPELTAAMGYSGTLLFFATSVAIGMSIAGSALTARALGRGHRTQANQIAGAALAIVLVLMTALACLAYPLLEPAVNAMLALPLPGVATRLVGASGVVGVVTLTALEATPTRIGLIARSLSW